MEQRFRTNLIRKGLKAQGMTCAALYRQLKKRGHSYVQGTVENWAKQATRVPAEVLPDIADILDIPLLDFFK